MPMHTKMLHKLNQRFGEDEILRTAKHADAFAPGRQLNADVVLRKGAAFYKSLQAFVEKMPGSMRESVRSVIYHALTSKPAKPIVFSWAPAYDHELTIWETTCGISVLYKSRYPADGAPKRTDGKD
ncbi:MAG TPA: hypothetical protein VGJ08_09490 [Rhizomicrobium sp.]|jgi:hypothetical protein